MNKKSAYKSKLEVDKLFVKVPINLKCLLSQNERDFFEAVQHLQSLGYSNTSDSLIVANSGLCDSQLRTAKKNLIQLGLISVKCDKGSRGTVYVINIKLYNELVDMLNSTPDSIERFQKGDDFRTKRTVKPLFHSVVNRLKRYFRESNTLTNEERIFEFADTKPITTLESELAHLQTEYQSSLLTLEEFRAKSKQIKLKFKN